LERKNDRIQLEPTFEGSMGGHGRFEGCSLEKVGFAGIGFAGIGFAGIGFAGYWGFAGFDDADSADFEFGFADFELFVDSDTVSVSFGPH